MNSRERRRLEAQQHNDAISYEKWLKENTNSQPRRSPPKVRVMGESRMASKAILTAALLLGMAHR